jgi:hypothetical protein
MLNPFTLHPVCRRWRTRLIAVLVAALGSLSIAGSGSAGLSPAPGERQAAAPSEDGQRPVTDDQRTVRLDLPLLNATERAWAADPDSIPVPARLGFGRLIADGALRAAINDPAHWEASAEGGHRLRLQVTSPGARGLRLGLALGAMAQRATLRVRSPLTEELEPISGAEISERLARVRAAASDASDADAPLFWTPLVRGETLTLELHLPPGVKPDDLEMHPVRVSHLFRLPFAAAGERAAGGDDCELDLACADDPLLERLARASAILLYTLPDGGSNACSGVLLADGDPATRIPYLVTAHHCVPDPARAASLETFWGARAAGCGEGPRRDPVHVSGGAELLESHQSLDTVLLRLRGDPPPDAVFAHWSSTLPERGTGILSVHHPFGRTAKVARGRLTHFWHCSDVAYCGTDAEPDGVHYVGVTWSAGLTGAGSSGAGAFRADTGELIGVLTGGLSSCEAPGGPDDFGRWLGW